MKRELFKAGLIILLLSACSVEQSQEVELYRSELNAKISPVAEPLPTEALTLTQALSMANQHNEELAKKGEEYVQALIEKNRVFANFLPTVALQPSYTVQDKGSTSPGVASGFRRKGDTLTRTDVPVVGSINIFNGFSDEHRSRAAEYTAEEKRQLLIDLQATILVNVAQAYYEVLRAEHFVQVLTESVRLREARLKDIEARRKNGLAKELEVAQTRADLAVARVSWVQAQSDVRNGRHTLAFLIGVPEVVNPLSDTFKVPEKISPIEEFEKAAAMQRQDLLAATAGVEAARHEVEVAFGQYYPSVSLNLTSFLYRDFFSDASKWSSLLSANLPLFSAGKIEADVRTAWSKLRQAALDESEAMRKVHKEVQVGYENLMTARQKLIELQSEVDAAQAAYQESQSAYANGLAINLDVLQAQDQLLNAQLTLTSERYDYAVFYLVLLRTTGRIG